MVIQVAAEVVDFSRIVKEHGMVGNLVAFLGSYELVISLVGHGEQIVVERIACCVVVFPHFVINGTPAALAEHFVVGFHRGRLDIVKELAEQIFYVIADFFVLVAVSECDFVRCGFAVSIGITNFIVEFQHTFFERFEL